jgi:hypothetical protein
MSSVGGAWVDFNADDGQVLIINYSSANQSGVYALNLEARSFNHWLEPRWFNTNMPVAYDSKPMVLLHHRSTVNSPNWHGNREERPIKTASSVAILPRTSQ